MINAQSNRVLILAAIIAALLIALALPCCQTEPLDEIHTPDQFEKDDDDADDNAGDPPPDDPTDEPDPLAELFDEMDVARYTDLQYTRVEPGVNGYTNYYFSTDDCCCFDGSEV
ncbi:MAG: hypothetical protein P9M14_17540, partial [Candidatus Alcyoniella australis]|nr:hypothetical protein [Candidatus Alcyoniella australis]